MCMAKRGAEVALRNTRISMADANNVLGIDEEAFGDEGVEAPLTVSAGGG